MVQWKTLLALVPSSRRMQSARRIELCLQSRFRQSAAAHGAQSLLKRDRKERFREFGRELPKAWGVLEGGGGDDVRFSKSRAFAVLSSRVSSSSSLSSPSLAPVVTK